MKGIEIIKAPHKGEVVIERRGIEIKRERKPVNIVQAEKGTVYLVIDCSGSMSGGKLQQVKEGVIKFAEDVREYAIGLIQFHETAQHLCSPTRNISFLKKRIREIKTGTTTNMAPAISMAHDRLKGKAGRKVMVVATDGMPNGPGDPKASLEAAEKAKRDGIEIIVIGTDDADKKFLKKLASRENLGIKVKREEFGKTIAKVAELLPQLPKPR